MILLNITLRFPLGKAYLTKKQKKIASKLVSLFKKKINIDYNSNDNIKLNIKNFGTESNLNNIINNIKDLNINLNKINQSTTEANYYLDLDYNLLIIGNGFDIAHNLKTTYIDFLNTYSKSTNNHKYDIKNNCIYLYLKEQKNQNGYWTDVEQSITNIVKFLEKIKITFKDNTSYEAKDFKNLLGESYLNFIHILCPLKYDKHNLIYTFTNNYFNESVRKLEYDLDSFINALEDYLLKIENTPINKPIYLNDISNIKDSITHILSFNYTDTFRKLYINDISDKNIDFIHGRLGKHNLVLGISETLNNEQENLELSCIYFKKYFQRIFKKTGAKYADWLSNKSGYEFSTVYIYGHSLDITDKEILSRIINDVNHVKKIVIFYHNETHYRQEISNLVKILDKNTFLKYVAEHRIEFKEQTNLQISKS